MTTKKRVVLVGTYKGGRMTCRLGRYNDPITDACFHVAEAEGSRPLKRRSNGERSGSGSM
ncbi:MAG: hypothetical protein J6Z49_04880 [Kiritimatiellae bacterium]|nr:hypothetical protein [Kiritimatiellia bacterium]